ncbi:MAG: hypothetical protein RMJ81_08380 [Candidatus Kryptonium sp.]|nr:hypothetical protein [Candidatus Kryptonium sp.]MCX7762625.1 hypothetical protein [Candidatus Kryptonium sp.]MDW8109655.1 hypothetical protein [Candidatus Kryptonium sp.]
MKSVLHILTLMIFIFGTLQFASVVSFCRMSSQAQTQISCLCSGDFDGDYESISQDRAICCSVKKFEKISVQDFSNFKDEISKLISFKASLKSEAISLADFFTPTIFKSYPISPPKIDIPILNSSLLI